MATLLTALPSVALANPCVVTQARSLEGGVETAIVFSNHTSRRVTVWLARLRR
jgi:hypothetical protein